MSTDTATKSFERPLAKAYKRHRILMTGDEGFIGSRLKNRLREMGHDVIGFDLKWGHGNDVRILSDVENAFKVHKPTIIYHLAALTGVIQGEEDPQSFMDTNVTGTENLIAMAQKYKVEQFVFFSSSSVYGNQTPPNGEDVAMSPISTYGSTKMIGELKMKESGLPYTIIRPFTVYGEGGKKQMVIFKWLERVQQELPIEIWGDGSSKRGYAYVGDVAEGATLVLDKPEAIGEVFNLGGNEIVSLKELVDEYIALLDAKVKYLPLPEWDIAENWADITKAQTMLGYEPKGKFIIKLREILNGTRT